MNSIRATSRRTFLAAALGFLGQQTLAASTAYVATGEAGSAGVPGFRSAPRQNSIPRAQRGAYVAFAFDSRHSAFPGITRTPDDQLLMTWRQAAGHVAQDGVIMSSYGDPTGTVWSTPRTLPIVLPPHQAGDLRDPHVSTAGVAVWLTFFAVAPAGNLTGVFAVRSIDSGHTWGPIVRIDPGLPHAAISAPVIEVAGKLCTAFYGKLAGEQWDSAWLATSTDDGTTWTHQRVANGPADGRDYQEPWVLHPHGALLMLHRYGTWDAIGLCASTDGGSTWSAPRRVVENAASSSAAVWASDGTIHLVVRDRTTRAAELVTSTDGGTSFQRRRTVLSRPLVAGAGGIGMTYAAPIEVSPGRVFCPIAYEISPTDSRLYAGWL